MDNSQLPKQTFPTATPQPADGQASTSSFPGVVSSTSFVNTTTSDAVHVRTPELQSTFSPVKPYPTPVSSTTNTHIDPPVVSRPHLPFAPTTTVLPQPSVTNAVPVAPIETKVYTPTEVPPPVTAKSSNGRRQMLGAIIVVIMLMLGGVGFLAYQNFQLQQQVSTAQLQLSALKAQQETDRMMLVEGQNGELIDDTPQAPGSYQNVELGFSFTYPEDWQRTSNCLVSGDADGKGYPCFASTDYQVSEDPNQTTAGQLMALVTEEGATIDQMLSFCQEGTVCENITIGDRNVLSLTSAQEPKTYQKVYFEQFGKLVTVTLLNSPSNVEDSQLIFQNILGNFVIESSTVVPDESTESSEPTSQEN